MSEIRNLTRNGETFYPLTHVDGVIGRNGVPLGEVNGIFDISEYNASGDPIVYPQYDTLALALGSVPQERRKGGMTIRYIDSISGEYVQYRYMSTSTSNTDFINTSNWQGIDEEPTSGSVNLVQSGGVFITTPTIRADDSFADLNIGDENGNVIAQFKDGHVKTKNFDSSNIKVDVEVKSDTSSASLNIGDENGNVIAQLKDGHIKTKNFDSSNASKLIEIPFNIEDFTTYVNDVVQIFKYPVTFIPNYRDYSVNIFMDTEDTNIRKQCRCLERFAEVTPLATGVYPMGVKVFTHDGYLLGEKSFNMTVINRPSNPSSVVNILCIGDSITQGITNLSGISTAQGASESASHPWVIEVKSYLGNREGNNTTPAGLNLPNIHLIGTNNTNNARHEGHGGWSVSSFLGTSSPFYINGQIDFNAYLAQDEVYDDTSNKGVDFIYILLGANGGTEKSIVNGKIFIDPSDYSRTIKNFLNKIKEQIIEGNGTYANPNCKVILLSYPSQWISGYGYHPNGSGQWTDGTVTARGMMACYYENVKIAAMDDYKSFCSTYMVAPFVDSENSFAYINKQINKRVSETYKALIEQVHPNSLGYTMIGEAIVRDIISRL